MMYTWPSVVGHWVNVGAAIKTISFTSHFTLHFINSADQTSDLFLSSSQVAVDGRVVHWMDLLSIGRPLKSLGTSVKLR